MTTADKKLFQPTTLGATTLSNRLVMAPMTRNRATPVELAPTEMIAEYYAQRASGGLLITEASQISNQGQGYDLTPGIYTEAQIAGWKKVTEAVHAKGGKIAIQLWHVGRISHPDLQENGALPVAPSAIAAKSKTFVRGAFVETPTPRALEIEEIPGIVADYAQAAKNAIAAGFDLVEIHAANGYLIDQFMKTGTNKRTDAYGGPLENRTRLFDEVLGAIAAAIGGDRTGVRISPYSPVNDATDDNPQQLAEAAVAIAAKHGLAFLHIVEGATGGPRDLPEGADLAKLKAMFPGAWMVNNGYDRDMAIEAAETGEADLVAIGRPWISNPDLVERFEKGAPLNEIDQATLYGGGAEGYLDYPTLAAQEEAV